MFCRFFEKTLQNILVVGPIYDKTEKLHKINNLIQKYDLIILNGSSCYPDNENLIERLKYIDSLLATNKVNYIVSDLDYQISLKNKLVNKWIFDKPNAINIKFSRGTQITIMAGGVLPNMSHKDLKVNLEISFVSSLGEVPWHQKYNGKLGYIISNNPLKAASPEFFNYSARIGTTLQTGRVYAQQVNENGLQKTFLL